MILFGSSRPPRRAALRRRAPASWRRIGLCHDRSRLHNAIAGEYGLAWREISLVLTMAVELMGLLAGLSLLNQKFRRGRTYSPPDTNPTASSEELFAHGASDDAGAVEKEQETAERSETEPENGKTRAK